jgi:hypothetical protein
MHEQLPALRRFRRTPLLRSNWPVKSTGKVHMQIRNNEEWFNKKQIALRYNIGERTVTDWMKRRILPFVKVGRVVRFHLPECELAVKKYQVKSRE